MMVMMTVMMTMMMMMMMPMMMNQMEAEVLEAAPETTQLYVERTKCIEGVVERGRPPVFVVQLQSVQTMDGGRAQLACRVVGRPMPVAVEWSRDAKALAADSPEFAATYDRESGDATLTVAEVFPEDAGLYKCFAENEYGQASTEAHLAVERTSHGLQFRSSVSVFCKGLFAARELD